ncbi:MAG: caspase family protein [Bacteroidetes bacterium]|nr:MAG: caspase family protein [Bacteroidota bacterium]
MSNKKQLFLFLMLLAILPAYSQTVYQAKYNFNNATDTTTYSAFLFKYNNGVNLIRLRYKDPVTGKTIVAATDVDQFFAKDAEGKEDYNTLLIKVVKAKDTARGLAYKNITLPIFIYKLDTATGYHEPKGVCKSEVNPVMDAGANFNSEYIQPTTQKKVAPIYFNGTDKLFYNLYGPADRGSLTLSEPEKKMKMYVLIAADTKDPSIGAHSIMDIDKMMKTYDTIRKYIGITDSNYFLQVISGDDLNKTNIVNAIAKMKPGKNGIVVFHFFGHGFRVNTRDEYPYISLKFEPKDSLDVVKNALYMRSVFEMIKKKQARLNLVFSDVCNINIGQDPISTLIPGQRGDDTWRFNPKNVRSLFLDPKPFSLLANGVKNGEASWSSNKLGNFFTYSFRQTLQVYCGDSWATADWNKVMSELRKNAIELASKKCCSMCCPTCVKKMCRLNPVYTFR